MEEILHQLIGGLSHYLLYMVSTILLVVKDFATIHSRPRVFGPDGKFRCVYLRRRVRGLSSMETVAVFETSVPMSQLVGPLARKSP